MKSPNTVSGDPANPASRPTIQLFTADNLLAETREPIEELTATSEVKMRRTTFTYDPQGAKTRELVDVVKVPASNLAGTATLFEAGRRAGYRYQATGSLAAEFNVDATSSEIRYLHNLDGTLTSGTDATTPTDVRLDIGWQLDGKPTSVDTAIEGNDFSTVTAGYLPDGERASQHLTVGAEQTTQTWDYNSAGMPTESLITYPDSSTADATWNWNSAGKLGDAEYMDVTETRSYLPDGTLTSSAAAGTTHTYTHDGVARIITRAATGGPSRTYNYDNGSRVTADGATSATWDANSNRRTYGLSAYTYRADNSLKTSASTGVDYDSSGRRKHPNPAVTTCSYSYDFLNRTTGITGSGSGCEPAAYLHDPLHARSPTSPART